ncbi:hypothetical protein [Noviherbaspirillum sp. ST9]|uniref:hypothetical protein n=1 Tax=Noviherbaspirillum sp. ST9 TaxID=3401606 RepID=UPI003B588ACE
MNRKLCAMTRRARRPAAFRENPSLNPRAVSKNANIVDLHVIRRHLCAFRFFLSM